MKKCKVFIAMATMLLLSSSVAFASTKVPTKEWNLYDNLYSWSAYVNKNQMYSNYYFRAASEGAFRIYGERLYEGDKGYFVRIYNKSTGDSKEKYVFSTAEKFDFYDTAFKDFNAGELMYFSIDGSTTQAEVSIVNGFFDSY